MKKIILVVIALVTVAVVAAPKANAWEPYRNAIGVHVGSVMGVNFKSFVAPRGAIEADLSYYINRGLMATAVYQHHFELVKNFSLYLGGGVNLGADNMGKDRDTKFAFGVDPNVGFEYSFPRTIVSLAIDYKPMINFTCPMHFDVASLRIRFTI